MINRRSLSALALSGIIALGTAGAASARHGADDQVGGSKNGEVRNPGAAHHAGDDHGQGHGGHGADDRARSARARHHRRHGADDGVRHRRHGADDGPNHT